MHGICARSADVAPRSMHMVGTSDGFSNLHDFMHLSSPSLPNCYGSPEALCTRKMLSIF